MNFIIPSNLLFAKNPDTMICMLRKSLTILYILLLSGCTNRPRPIEQLWLLGSQAYYGQRYKKALHYLSQIEIHYSDAGCAKEALELVARAHFALGNELHSAYHYTETIKTCDFIITVDPDLAKAKDLYILRIRAYYRAIPWKLDRCSQMITDTLKAIDDYYKVMPNSVNRYRKELIDIKSRCSEYLIAQEILKSKRLFEEDMLPVAALAKLDPIINSERKSLNTSEAFYRTIEIRDKMNCTTEELMDIFSSARWLDPWKTKAIKIISRRKLTPKQKLVLDKWKI